MQKVFETVYLPQEKVVVGTSGPWNDEMPWHPPPFLVALGIVPPPESTDQSDSRLLSWVTEGVSLSSSPADRFQIDGVARSFSTLRPPEDDDGALRVSVGTAPRCKLPYSSSCWLRERYCSFGRRAIGSPDLALLFAVVFLAAVFQPSLAGACWKVRWFRRQPGAADLVREIHRLARPQRGNMDLAAAGGCRIPLRLGCRGRSRTEQPSDSEGGKV